MHSLQLLLRASPATLLLFLCLQLGINKSQEDTPPRQVLRFNLHMPWKAKANEKVTLRLILQTELRECMVVKAFLASNNKIPGPFNNKFTRCLCNNNPLNFFWNFKTNRTTTFAVVVDIVQNRNICPHDLAVVPITSNGLQTFRTLFIE